MASRRRIASPTERKKAMEQAIFELGRATGLLLKATEFKLATKVAQIAEEVSDLLTVLRNEQRSNPKTGHR